MALRLNHLPRAHRLDELLLVDWTEDVQWWNIYSLQLEQIQNSKKRLDEVGRQRRRLAVGRTNCILVISTSHHRMLISARFTVCCVTVLIQTSRRSPDYRCW